MPLGFKSTLEDKYGQKDSEESMRFGLTDQKRCLSNNTKMMIIHSEYDPRYKQ
jgi:hypothetical protein